MKRVKEVSEMSGITKRTLQYYDDKGLLPAKRSGENYRLYDDDDIEKLWKILFCREIGFPIEEIKEMLSLSAGNQTELLDKRISSMLNTIRELDSRIKFAESIKLYGVPDIRFYDDSSQLTFVEFIHEYKDMILKEVQYGSAGKE